MNAARKTALSLATFALICFFLPWFQLSCAGVKDSLNGFNLAQRSDQPLWLIRGTMALVLVLGLVRFVWEKKPAIFGLAGAVGGATSAYLMYHEQSGAAASGYVVAVQYTGIFWISFLACVGVAISSVWFYSKRSLGP
jgi:hypothetical protein